MKDIGVYIHVPFCERKCYYCDFYSIKGDDDVMDKYVAELCVEIKKAAGSHIDKSVKTIYLGGGTPSLLKVDYLDKILNTVRSFFATDIKEVTIEVNPNSSDNISSYPSLGINRLSIGVQSTDDMILKKLGRLHNSVQAIDALDRANNFFDNISADIIIGVDENQDVARDLEIILPRVKHLSSYILKVEDGTLLKMQISNKTVSIATEDAVIRQYDKMHEICKEHGFYRYEVSNFAKFNYESKHNLSYWKMIEYLGFGPSAHSYVDGRRYYNSADLKDYFSGMHSGYDREILERPVSLEDDITEFVMLALRTPSGLVFSEFKSRYGFDYLDKHLGSVKKMGEYLIVTKDKIAIRPEYYLVQNYIIRELL